MANWNIDSTEGKNTMNTTHSRITRIVMAIVILSLLGITLGITLFSCMSVNAQESTTPTHIIATFDYDDNLIEFLADDCELSILPSNQIMADCHGLSMVDVYNTGFVSSAEEIDTLDNRLHYTYMANTNAIDITRPFNIQDGWVENNGERVYTIETTSCAGYTDCRKLTTPVYVSFIGM